MQHSNSPANAGFSLIEVLVALIIIAVGLLGLAKLQALAYANTGISSQRSLAAIEASSMVSSIRANRLYWSKLTPPQTVTVTGSGLTVTATDPTLSAALSTVSAATTAGITPTYCQVGGGGVLPCTAAAMAAYDLETWVFALRAVLPSPTATITCPAPPAAVTTLQAVTCELQESWIERSLAANAQSQGTTMAAPTYTLYVVP